MANNQINMGEIKMRKYKKETSEEKEMRIANEIKIYEKKPRSWVDSEPKNWSSAKLRGWYKCRPH